MLKKKTQNTRVVLVILIFLAVLLGAFFYKFYLNREVSLKTEKKSGNINILLLGKGGGNHEGPDLTDTIMVASIDQANNIANLISIPRDLWVPDLDGKINKAYSDGQEQDKKGKLLAKKIVGDIVGKQIDYVVVVDFSGFVKAIDFLGGIEVDVKHSFDDFEYPIEGAEDDPCGHPEEDLESLATASSQLEAFPCRYKHLSFEKGIQYMDGKRALEFVRSRHSEGSEGSDFARSERQQQIISAVRTKVFSIGTILNPVKILGLLNILNENVDRDIELGEIDDFINLANKMKDAKINNIVIDEGDEENRRFGLLYHPQISEDQRFQWVLIPRRGDGEFSEIKEFVKCVESGLICSVGEYEIEKKEELKENAN